MVWVTFDRMSVRAIKAMPKRTTFADDEVGDSYGPSLPWSPVTRLQDDAASPKLGSEPNLLIRHSVANARQQIDWPSPSSQERPSRNQVRALFHPQLNRQSSHTVVSQPSTLRMRLGAPQPSQVSSDSRSASAIRFSARSLLPFT